MADITMCFGEGCPRKGTCYRFLAEKNPLYQSYFAEVPLSKDGNTCEEFWEAKSKSVKRRLDAQNSEFRC